MRRFGSAWISGVLGLVLGVAALLLVVALRLPLAFSVLNLQNLYGKEWVVYIYSTLTHAISWKGHPVPQGYREQFAHPFRRAGGA